MMVTHLLSIAGATTAIYFSLIALLRVFGRHELTQLTIPDVIVILTLGSAVETSMIRGDIGLAAGLTAASTLLVVNRVLSELTLRSRWLNRMLNGRALVLVHNGAILERNLRRAGLTHDDLFEALRQHEHETPEQVRFAVVEVDGTISVVDR